MKQKGSSYAWVHDLLGTLMLADSVEQWTEMTAKYRKKHTTNTDALILRDADQIAETLTRLMHDSRVADSRLATLSETERAELEETVRIINENRFDYYFQPIVNTYDGEIYSYEALMRPRSEMKLTPLHILKYAAMLNRLADIESETFRNVLSIIDERKTDFCGRYVFIDSIPDV